MNDIVIIDKLILKEPLERKEDQPVVLIRYVEPTEVLDSPLIEVL